MFGKNKISNDPEKALKDADKKLNKGLTGFATKAFMGKENLARMNQGIAMGQGAIDMQKVSADLNQYGIPALAKVLSIQDTGQLVNFDPVVILQLEVTPQAGPAFQTAARTIVSKLAIPRVGESINIKYSPADPSKITIV
jgi:hypothetical protein